MSPATIQRTKVFIDVQNIFPSILTKFAVSRQIFIDVSQYQISWKSAQRSRAGTCGQMDRRT
jgi:hypothetical protein